MPIRVILAILLLPTTLTAQWRLTLSSGTAAVRGDARDDIDPAHPSLRADRPATIALALAHQQGPWRIGVEVRRISADLAETSESVAAVTRGALDAWGAGLEAGHRLAGHAGGAILFGLAGVGFDRWTFDLADGAGRSRMSARGALEADFPVARHWGAAIRGALTTGPSVFTAEELPEGFSRAAHMTAGITLGLARWW